MQLSELKTERASLDYSTAGKAAEIKASQLSGEDLGRWMFWQTENEIKSLLIRGVTHSHDEVEFSNRLDHRITVKGKGVGVSLNPTDTVWVCDTKPEVTVHGVQVPDGRRR